jgi:hypothetical protein
MADEVRYFVVTVPANTPKTAPQVYDISFDPRNVESVEWKVPPGPSGLLGWYLSMGRAQVAPLPIGSYVIADNQSGVFTASKWPDSGAWTLTAYNTGAYPHSVYLTFHLNLITQPRAFPSLFSATDLMPSPDLSRAGPPVKRRLW